MEPIYREYEFELRSVDGDGRTMEGYVAVFDAPTNIREFGRSFTEVVAPGAFRKTLSERTPVLMFNHGKHPMVGDMPIGQVMEAREDAHGLFVKARLFDNNLVEPVRQAIAGHAITGMSFRFEPVQDKWNAKKSHRTLVELRVPEFGPVVMPAYVQTSVSVRMAEVVGAINDEAGDDPETRRAFFRELIFGPTRPESTPDSEADRDDTATEDPGPSAIQEPATATTPEPTSKRDRLMAVAKLKGLVTNGSPDSGE